MVDAVLAESVPLSPGQPDTESKGIWRARLIEADVQGSSGYYPADVLQRDGATAFPAGTHVYFDHPTSTEETDRPERSVRDLAGTLIDDARFEESGDGRGLFARIQFLPGVKEQIQALAPHIGLSIRAAGKIEETSTGRVVRSIHKGLSVDVVTRAGAGGRLITMTESKQPDSPPANDAHTTSDASIPATTGTGSLLSEVAALKGTVIDSNDQMQVEITRVTQHLKEARREIETLIRENKKTAEDLRFLRERQEAVDQRVKESKSIKDVLTELLKANMPLSSTIRIAENYSEDRDLHEDIQQEREYAKKLLRESERGEYNRSSGLGLTESLQQSTASERSPVSDDELKNLEAVLGGGLY